MQGISSYQAQPSSREAIINAEMRFGEIDKARELMARLDAR